MRILEVTNFMPPHPGGIEKVAETLLTGLGRRGHQVEWLASAEPEAPGRSGPLTRVPAWNWLEANLHVPMPVWTPAGWRALQDRVRWADVVHFHDCLYLSSLGTVTVARALGRPTLCTQHVAEVPYGGALDLVQAAAYRTLGRAVLTAADRVVTYSPHVVAYFSKLGLKKPLDLIPLGFDPVFRPLPAARRAEVRQELGFAPEAPVVIFAARLVPKKGVATVAEVQTRLAERGVRLLVAGDGPLAHLVKDLPGTTHLREVPYTRMPELYGMADALLLPSRGEGLPLTLQEGMLTGLPAVVSTDPSFTANVGAAPGVRLVEGTEALVEAVLAALAAPPSLRAEVASWSQARWGLETFLDRYEQALAELSARRPRR